MKPIFSNLMAYGTSLRLPDNFAELVDKEAFDTFGRNAYRGEGFIELSDGRRLIESDGRVLVRYFLQEKHINKSALDAMFKERLKKIEDEGRELSGADEWKMKEQLESEMLPYSPVTTLSCYVMFCTFENRIYLSCSNDNVAESVFAFIRRMFGSLPVWPVEFCQNISFCFSSYVANGCKATPELSPLLRVDDSGVLMCNGEKGKKFSAANFFFADEPIENLLLQDEWFVRGIDISLMSSEKPSADVDATLRLSMPASGYICLKKFNYADSALLALDVDMANEKGTGDMAHQYAVEMLIVGRYVPRIFDALAAFAGGYRKETDSNADNNAQESESQTAVSAGADE